MFQTTGTTHLNQTARMAEQGDARMALQRREDDDRRRGGRGRKDDDGTLANDEASVSVEALQVFLANLLRAHDTWQQRDIAASAAPVQETIIKVENKTNQATPSARAARAYASASRTARRTPAMESAIVTQENPLAAAGRSRLTGQEKQQISAIQENLAALVEHGVTEMTIQRGDTFLGSLSASAEEALVLAQGR